MPDIQVRFSNGYGESRQFQIWDVGSDPNAPRELFNGYLDVDQTTDPIPVHSNDFGGARIRYQRSDGAAEEIDNLNEGDTVRMT